MVEISGETRADISVIDRVVARDPSAIAELYDRHSRLLFGLILRILKDRSEAEDVLQEVFLLVWTRAETYRAALGSPAAWLVRIARNRAIDRMARTVCAFAPSTSRIRGRRRTALSRTRHAGSGNVMWRAHSTPCRPSSGP